MFSYSVTDRFLPEITGSEHCAYYDYKARNTHYETQQKARNAGNGKLREFKKLLYRNRDLVLTIYEKVQISEFHFEWRKI